MNMIFRLTKSRIFFIQCSIALDLLYIFKVVCLSFLAVQHNHQQFHKRCSRATMLRLFIQGVLEDGERIRRERDSEGLRDLHEMLFDTGNRSVAVTKSHKTGPLRPRMQDQRSCGERKFDFFNEPYVYNVSNGKQNWILYTDNVNIFFNVNKRVSV